MLWRNMLLGIVLAPVLILLPGYFWSRVLEVGPASRTERAAWSLVLSLGAVPILGYNFFRLVPYNAATLWTFALLAISLPAALELLSGAAQPVSRRLRLGRWWILPVLLAVLAVTAVMDWGWDSRLYRGVPSADYAKHVIITDAVHRTGVHPVNPAFHPGRPLPLFYYFFWFLLCSMVDGLSLWRIGPQAAVFAMTAWCALGLSASVVLLARHFLRPCTKRTLGISLALLLATGLDLPGYALWTCLRVEPGKVAWRFLLHPSVDGWNWDGEVFCWLASAAWVPHHLGAAVMGMIGVLVVFGLPAPSGHAVLWVRALVFALAAASCLGTSIWVSLVFSVFWLLWAALALWRRWRDDLGVLLRAALPAGLLAGPFVLALSRARLDHDTPLAWDVRNVQLWDTYARGLHLGAWKEVIDLLLLLPLYVVELGVFALGGLYWWRHRRRPIPRREGALILLFAVSMVLVSVLRSTIQNNDFGWRGILPAQLVLLLATAWMVERLWRRRRWPVVVVAGLALGYVTVAFDWVGTMVHPPLVDRKTGGEGRRNWAMKRFYEQIRASTPAGAIVQQNPYVTFAYDHSFYANRQSVVLDRVNGPLFGRQGSLFERVSQEIRAIFEGILSATSVQETAHKYGILVLVIQDRDPAWRSPVWEDVSRFRLLAECEYARAYQVRP